ncbi:serine/threonine-protein kinase [Lachnospiraceae bacterium 46-15]
MERDRKAMQELDNLYENLAVLGDKREKESLVFLVRNRENGKIAVKKQVDFRVLSVYSYIQQIHSCHLANVYAYAGDGETGLVIEEYIGGTSLEEYLESGQVSDEKVVCQWIHNLLVVLSEIHRGGIVHRDITPGNILISGDGVLKLIDFGIARFKKAEQRKDTTVLGTVGYAAPEQFGFYQTDARTDIYAVGVLMNQLFTGKLPGEKLFEREPYRKMIIKCTEIDARARYQSVDEMRQMLEVQMEKLSPGLIWEKKGREDFSLAWLPGFRTASAKKNVLAVIVYVFLILISVSIVAAHGETWQTLVLEATAVFLYIWAAGLAAGNAADWDQRVWPICRLSRAGRITVRIALWVLFVYFGGCMQNYVQYDMMGLPRP